MQAVSSGKVVNPYDRDQEQGWDHVDFVDRRAAVGGELRQPGAGRVVPVARAGAGRRVPRRLQGPQRAERRRRHRSARRVHAQEAPHPARAGRGGIAGLPGRRRAQRASRIRWRRGRCRCSISAVWWRAPSWPDASLLYHLYGRQFPLDDRRFVVIEDLPEAGGVRRDGAAVGARPDRLARVAARRPGHGRARAAGPGRRLDPPADGAHARLPARAGQPRAPPTSAGAAARCRAPSRATCRWRATWPPTCSRPPIACPPATPRRHTRARRRPPAAATPPSPPPRPTPSRHFRRAVPRRRARARLHVRMLR